ncbi:hypothetical protein C823_000582 [Eubacterium plexicaudatum ASF492]|nr:hypothetical protein C823_000582 [Eubacterium plexicaudatum ASF492]
MNRKINSYTPEGRAEIHKNLDRIDMTVLHYLMRNPVLYRTIEYNDNRLSLYSAQMGKCAVSGKVLSVGRQIDGNANSELFFRHLSY